MDIFFGKESSLTRLLKTNGRKQVFISLRNEVDKKNFYLINNSIKKNIFIIGGYPTSKLNSLKFNNYDSFFQLNFKKIFDLLSSLNAKKIAKIFFFSSASVSAIEEGNIDKYNDKKKIYSLSKNIIELFLIIFCKKFNIKLNILRIHNLYNKLDEHSFLNTLKKKKSNLIVENLDDVRDFVHVTDAARLIKRIIAFKTSKINFFDIGTGVGYSIRDIIEFLKIDKKFIYEKKNRNFLISIANTTYLKKRKLDFKFKRIEKYLKPKLKINQKLIFLNQELKNIIIKLNKEYPSTVIYGCGNAGKQMFNLLQGEKENIGLFIDDYKSKDNQRFLSKPVVSFDDFLILTRYVKFKKIIFAIPSINKKKFQKIKDLLKKRKIIFENLPLTRRKDQVLKIEDLSLSIFEKILKRKELLVDFKQLNFLTNKTVLITGGAGSIGSNLSSLILKTKIKKLIVYDNSEMNIYNLQNIVNNDKRVEFILGDINDRPKLSSILNKNQISFIFHAAANKHVNITQKNALETIKNNIFGTLNVLDISKKFNVHLTIISTDKAARPKSLLGYSKRFSEILNLCVNHNKVNILRFGNVIASAGSVLPKWIKQVNNYEDITLTSSNAKRYFMTINEASYLALKTCKLNYKNKIFILNMGEKIKILKIINILISLKKKIDPSYQPKIKIVGLQKGEKKTETLSLNNKLLNTTIKNIYYVNEPIYKKENIKKTLDDLKECIEKCIENKAKKILYNFFKSEK
jgi:FlaA1/EpsC-like NDP-sugar epimerase